MKDNPANEFLKEISSSPKERAELQEVASLLSNMQEELPSSSFQANLRAELLERARQQSKQAAESSPYNGPAAHNTVFHPLVEKPAAILHGQLPRPVFALAAALLCVLILFFSLGPQDWGAGVADPDETPAEIIAARDPEIYQEEEVSSAGELPEPEKETAGPETAVPSEKDDLEEGTARDEEQKSADHLAEGAENGTESDQEQPDQRPGRNGPDPAAEQDDPALQEEPERGGQPEREPEKETDPLPMEPQFDIWEKERAFRLAGVIHHPELHYGEQGAEDRGPVGNIAYSWRPGMFVEASVKNYPTGSEDWAKRVLSEEGFSVHPGDKLAVTAQETQRGKFLEIFFTPQRGSALPLVVYYEKERGIIGYYYQEKGTALQAGYYPILDPARAFGQIKDVPVYSEYKRLDFSFRKVSLVYHDFKLLKNGKQQLIKLPAYRFTGMEISRGGSEIDIYLPAVSLP